MKLRYLSLLLLFCFPLLIIAQENETNFFGNPTDLEHDPLLKNRDLDKETEQHLKALYKDYIRYDGYNAKKISLVGTSLSNESCAKMLSELPSAITFTYNDIVKEAIDLYRGKRARTISSALSLAEVYFPEIELILDKNQLPYELKYLTVVESALNPAATSRRGAKGLWQLMPATAKILGLKVNSLVDERCEIEKSTEAACHYLKDMYILYDDWLLALAAYNSGPGNVNKAIRRANGQRDFWSIYPYLPRETRNYIPIFIGVYFTMYYYRELGLEPRSMADLELMDYFEINKKVALKDIASIINLPVETIKTLNPQFRRAIVPGHIEPYKVRLPFLSTMVLEAKQGELKELDTIKYTKLSKKGNVRYSGRKVYKVRGGDTLSSIAHRYRISVSKLKRRNHLRSSRIRVGQRLVIY